MSCRTGLAERQLAEEGQDGGAPAGRVQPFTLHVADDETGPELRHREVIKIPYHGSRPGTFGIKIDCPQQIAVRVQFHG
jgi:hypothetical protein